MELSGRLKLITQMVPMCRTVCDVATDHALIPIELLLNAKCERVIASDINERPLEVAKKNISQYDLQDKIEIRVGSGVSTIVPGEAEVIVIAGIGGILMSELLESGKDVLKASKVLILQPMNYYEDVREWLYDNGFLIYDEELIDDDEYRIYNIIAAKYDGLVRKDENAFYHIGRRLVEKRHPLLERFIKKKIDNIDRALQNLKHAKKDMSLTICGFETLKNRLCSLLDEL